MFERVYELPLTRNYVASWTLQHAVRELIQNALDSESPFEWILDKNVLRIISRHTVLNPKTLLLGSTSKAENKNAIGNFGEGYKIALLVLAREGYPVTVVNGDKEWKPEFRYSKAFDDELLCIVETKAGFKNQGLTFIIKLQNDDDEDRIRKCCLQMQDDVGEFIEVPQGRILLDRKGELFVGGLFICKTQLDYSYDIHPQHIKLERDRQTVRDWNLKLVTKEMWFDSKKIDKVVKLIEDNSPDMHHADMGTPEIVAEACYRRFKEKHPGSVAAQNQDELNRLVASGMERVVVISPTYHNVVTNSKGYRSQRTVKIKTPRQILSAWIETHCPSVADHAKHEILQQSDKWRLK